MPWSMFKWRINMTPGARVIDQDHQANGSPSEYIERIKALVQAELI